MPKPKLRKMLGDVNATSTVALIQLIDTQSKETICNWCIGYAETRIIQIFEKLCPNDNRPRAALIAARDYLAGNVKFPVVKDIILNQCHDAARELEGNPTAQAAARAIGQASAVVHTLSHSLGLYFYGAAAIAYDRVGLEESVEVYSQIAEEVCLDYTNSRRAIAVEGEPNRAKIKWNC